MAEVLSISLVNGIPTTGTGTARTLSYFDVGAGTAGSGTMRVIMDSSQVDSGEWEQVPASQTNQILGPTGAVGDYLQKLICVVSTAATAQVQLKDGSGTAFTVLANSPGGGIGTYEINFEIVSQSGAWQVTTGAGVLVIAVGSFT